MKRILFILALVMSAMGVTGQERIRIFASDQSFIDGYFISETDSSYIVRGIIQEFSIEECNDTIYYLKKDFIGGYVCNNPRDGGVSPGQWDAYCAVRKQVHKLAEEKTRKEFKRTYGRMGTCHEIWYYEKLIFKEKYNIDWKSPADMNPHIIFD